MKQKDLHRAKKDKKQEEGRDESSGDGHTIQPWTNIETMEYMATFKSQEDVSETERVENTISKQQPPVIPKKYRRA